MDREAGCQAISEIAMTRSVLDRCANLRADSTGLLELWRNPASRLLVMHGDRVRMGSGPSVSYELPTSTSPTPPVDAYFLGSSDGHGYFAVAADAFVEGDMKDLREVGALLPALDAELMATTLALANWHRTHTHCPRCGGPTDIRSAGWVRQCRADASLHFPRTDPAVIMLITNERDEALLGHRGPWPDAWYSTLAGFVEPGESAESAVAREVLEEVGITVAPDTVWFRGSQPWPFPSSLMIGFRGEADAEQVPRPDGDEIAAAQWFAREELARKCELGEVKIPPRFSISRYLIEDWYGAELPGSWSRP